MGVTIDTSAVKAAGKIARGIGTDDIGEAKGEIDDAEDNAGSARISVLQSKKSLDEVCFQWRTATGALAITVQDVGDKLVTTAGTYSQGDDDSADEFAHVEHKPGPHEDPNG